jgi:hypothetical protein
MGRPPRVCPWLTWRRRVLVSTAATTRPVRPPGSARRRRSAAAARHCRSAIRPGRCRERNWGTGRHQGPSGPPAPYRQPLRMAHARCAGGSVVASDLTIPAQGGLPVCSILRTLPRKIHPPIAAWPAPSGCPRRRCGTGGHRPQPLLGPGLWGDGGWCSVRRDHLHRDLQRQHQQIRNCGPWWRHALVGFERIRTSVRDCIADLARHRESLLGPCERRSIHLA